MKSVGGAGPPKAIYHLGRMQRAYLNVMPALISQLALQTLSEGRQVFRFTHQQVAMIGEGKRYESSSSKLALHWAEHRSILQGFPWRGCCINDRSVSVGAAKCLQPSDGMENRPA